MISPKPNTSVPLVIFIAISTFLVVCVIFSHNSFYDHLARVKAIQSIDSAEEATNLYPSVPIADIAIGKWNRPRATITGIVQGSHAEADGDRHFRVTDGKAFVVCEIIPELPLPHPKDGDKVTVKGIVREDGQHGWWELHPVIGWK